MFLIGFHNHNLSHFHLLSKSVKGYYLVNLQLISYYRYGVVVICYVLTIGENRVKLGTFYKNEKRGVIL